jgi:hypothetical protein
MLLTLAPHHAPFVLWCERSSDCINMKVAGSSKRGCRAPTQTNVIDCNIIANARDA